MGNRFIDEALSCIQDDRLLGQRRETGPGAPIVDLMNSYNALADRYDEVTFQFMDGQNSGRELKDAIGHLDPKDQVQLITEFTENMKRATSAYGYETPKERDERILKHNIIYACVIAILILVVVAGIGGVMSLAVLSGKFENPIATTYFNTTLEIFKVIFSIKDH